MWDTKINFDDIETKPLSKRINKFRLGMQFSDIRKVALAIKRARKKHQQIIWMTGAHTIKLGLSKYLIKMMRNNYITHLAMNGAASIHDFEIAYQGATSEDVNKNLKDGSFGNWEETGKMMNEALKDQKFMGYALANLCKDQEYSRESVMAWALALEIPVTVHVAIGTDIIHQHPSCNGEDIGRTSHNDFRMFTQSVTKLGSGGVVVNSGSAVILPEVFLKAVSVSRNLGHTTKGFTAVAIDMNRHYRVQKNVLERPTNKSYYLIGQLEEYLPLLWERLE